MGYDSSDSGNNSENLTHKDDSGVIVEEPTEETVKKEHCGRSSVELKRLYDYCCLRAAHKCLLRREEIQCAVNALMNKEILELERKHAEIVKSYQDIEMSLKDEIDELKQVAQAKAVKHKRRTTGLQIAIATCSRTTDRITEQLTNEKTALKEELDKTIAITEQLTNEKTALKEKLDKTITISTERELLLTKRRNYQKALKHAAFEEINKLDKYYKFVVKQNRLLKTEYDELRIKYKIIKSRDDAPIFVRPFYNYR